SRFVALGKDSIFVRRQYQLTAQRRNLSCVPILFFEPNHSLVYSLFDFIRPSLRRRGAHAVSHSNLRNYGKEAIVSNARNVKKCQCQIKSSRRFVTRARLHSAQMPRTTRVWPMA